MASDVDYGDKNYKGYCYGNYVKIKFDQNGYVLDAKGFRTILWCVNPENIDDILIEKHITQLLIILKKYCCNKEIYDKFLLEIFIDFEFPIKKFLKEKSSEILKFDLVKKTEVQYIYNALEKDYFMLQGKSKTKDTLTRTKQKILRRYNQ